MSLEADAERVYQFIWNTVTEHEELPSTKQIAEALRISHDDVLRCIGYLRLRQLVLPNFDEPPPAA